MSENRNSITNILKVTLILCLFCSIVVSFAAIALKPLQVANLALERNANMLAAAGMIDLSDQSAKSLVPAMMTGVITKIVDLNTGDFSNAIAPDDYDQLAAAQDPQLSELLTSEQDIASIKRRENLGEVFFIVQDNTIDSVILPIRGYGLWSTLYGFIALEKDGNTVRGLGFYEHGETPGLGGEVDNPKWKAIWKGKEILARSDQHLAIAVVKNLNPADAEIINKVDSISGASLTSRGVNNLVQFWLGKNGYEPFLEKLRNNEVQI